MRHLVVSIIAIAIAGVAAVAATTALLNAPLRIGPATSGTPTPAQAGQTQAPVAKNTRCAAAERRRAATPRTRERRARGADPAGAKPPAEGETPEDPDKDPYEGIAPEDLPPDLQYDADASVSFPTNLSGPA